MSISSTRIGKPVLMMDVKVSKDKSISRWVDLENLIYFFNSSLPLPPALQALRHQPCDYCRELTSAHSQHPDSNREPLVSEQKWLTTKLRALMFFCIFLGQFKHYDLAYKSTSSTYVFRYLNVQSSPKTPVSCKIQ